jgi:hypothetical protein
VTFRPRAVRDGAICLQDLLVHVEAESRSDTFETILVDLCLVLRRPARALVDGGVGGHAALIEVDGRSE